MRQYDLVLEKYWISQSGYFRLATTVVLGMGITDGKLVLCCGVSEQSRDKKLLMREYNSRTVYDCFKNSFPVDFGIPDLNLPPMPIDNSPHLNKRARHTPDPLPAAIYVDSKKSVSTLTTPCYSPQVILLTSYAPKT